MTYRLKKVLFFTCCAAVAVRSIALYTVSGSALEAYNTLPGLDMETLMRFSNWMSSDPESAPMFVLHRFLLFGSLLIGGGSYNTLVIHALQAVLVLRQAVPRLTERISSVKKSTSRLPPECFTPFTVRCFYTRASRFRSLCSSTRLPSHSRSI